DAELVLFANNASSAQYYPDYWLESQAKPAAAYSTGDVRRDQAQHFHGIGWTPSVDIDHPVFTAPQQRHCLQIMRQEGVQLSTGRDAQIAFTACDDFFLLESALL